jgi:hypothetical protein
MTLTLGGSDSPQVTLYVRGDMFGANDRQNAVARRLGALEDAGRIDGYDVTVWSDRVRLDGDRPEPAADLYRSFVRWADAEGVDIDPFFSVRERESFVDGTARELVLPVMCLAVRTDDGLETVAPHRDGAETTSIVDCLDRLEALDAPARSVTVPAED